jgi:hypothetical protein
MSNNKAIAQIVIIAAFAQPHSFAHGISAT